MLETSTRAGVPDSFQNPLGSPLARFQGMATSGVAPLSRNAAGEARWPIVRHSGRSRAPASRLAGLWI